MQRNVVRFAVAVGSVILMGAAVGAVVGTHQATGNKGYLGSDAGGVVGYAFVSNIAGVVGVSNLSSGTAGVGKIGVQGIGIAGDDLGVSGESQTGTGVLGKTGGPFSNNNANGVVGLTTNNGVGVWGLSSAGGGYAGYFSGNVFVNGTLSKSAGTFRIDHPLDPANKYLSHSFVESPDMKNIYDGVVTLDHAGEAEVVLPDWFEALNKDFRYQLTCIGEHAPVFIKNKISEGRFTIGGGYAGMEISWQVTGSRKDAYALAHPVEVESWKPMAERGLFLHALELGQAPSSSMDYSRVRAVQERSSQPRRLPAMR